MYNSLPVPPAIASIAVEEPPSQLKLLFTRKESSYALGVSVRSIDYLVARKELTARKIGKRILVTRQSLVSFSRGDHAELTGRCRNPA